MKTHKLSINEIIFLQDEIDEDSHKCVKNWAKPSGYGKAWITTSTQTTINIIGNNEFTNPHYPRQTCKGNR